MATPPQGPKNDVGETLSGPSRPLLRLAKVTQKRGFSRRFPGNLPTVFSAGFPAVFRRFDAGFPAVLPTVLPAVSRQFASGFPAVSRRFPGGFPAVSQRFPSGFPAVFRRFSSSFPAVLPVVRPRFPGGFRAVWPAVLPTVRRRRGAPGSTPVRLRSTPSSERNCRAIPYTLSSLQTQHMGRGKFPPVHGVPGRSAAGRNPTPLVEVLGDRIAVQDASGGISLGTSPTGHSGQRDADFA